MKDVTCLVKSGTFPKYWIWVRGNLFVQVVIRTGRYLYRSLSVQVVSSQTQIYAPTSYRGLALYLTELWSSALLL